MSSLPLIPVILGETASGKTAVGLQLAQLLGGEIISVDSRKVYQGLPVGTATPSGVWKNGVYWVGNIPHHLTAFLSPDQAYTAGDFVRDATQLIESIQQRGKIPILVGGTGFYFKALRDGLPQLPERDEKFRAALEARITNEGVTTLYDELKATDPVAATNITHNDKHKIIRALEIKYLTNRPFSDWKQKKRSPLKQKFVVMGLRFPKELVDQRIEERSRKMVESGMIEETAAVLAQSILPNCPALSSFGYREAVEVVQGRLPRSEFLAHLIKGTKAYAKRQRTWFRTQTKPVWFDCDANTKKEEISLKMKAFLDNFQI